MMLILLPFWTAHACDVAEAVTTLRGAADKDAYLCLTREEDAPARIAAALGGEGDARLTRALALWLLRRADRELDVALVRSLSPADRRLLADGIRARRGRRSPVPDHAAVFEQFAWYEPSAGYTDGRLTERDRANIATVDRPPPAPTPAAAVEAPEAPEAAAPPELTRLCGCDGAGSGSAGVSAAAALLATLGLRRGRARRRG